MNQNKIIGYTSGVFDLFHIGHLNILKRAKEKCDYLIVSVSTDELVVESKKKKPIIPFEDRVEIVTSIKYVNKVIPQYNFDKIEAWKTLKFDKIFVGDDWKNTDKWVELERKFKELCVEVVFFPYTKKVSSTILKQSLKGIDNY